MGRVLQPGGRHRLPRAALAVVAAAVSLMIASASEESLARDLNAIGGLLLLGAAVTVVVSGRWIVVAMVMQLVMLGLYLAAGFPGGAELPPLLAGLFVLAASGRRTATVVLGTVFLGGGAIYRVAVERESLLTVTIGTALPVLVAVLGDSLHLRTVLRQETAARLRAAESEKEVVARARVAEEGMRIARELHDVMAHTITAMSIQVAAALDQLDREPTRSREALIGARRAGKEAMRELRAIVSVLRAGDTAHTVTAAPPRLTQLAEAADTVRSAGIDVDMTVDIGDTDLPSVVEVVCVRVVQEALTNVLRHAQATAATVDVVRDGRHLRVTVVDDGRGGDQCCNEGHVAIQDVDVGFGLQGLRERVETLGGRFVANSPDSGGFAVHALLPLRGEHVEMRT